MNSHERLQSELIDLVHRELSPWRALHVRLHLVHCAPCRMEKKRVETLWRSLRSLHTPTPTRLRPKLKGKPMQVRVALAAFSAVFCAIGGTVISRTLQRPFVCTRVISPMKQYWSVEGDIRGKLIVVAPGKSLMEEDGNNTMDIQGPGTSSRATVTVKPCLDSKHLGPEIARLDLEMNQPTEVRDKTGRVIALAKLVPFTTEEDQRYKKAESDDRQRMVELYQSPFTISLDSSHRSFGGVLQMPGLIAWNDVSDRDQRGMIVFRPDGKVQVLESQGFGWKMLGYARVTMTLNTDPRRPNYTRSFAPESKRYSSAELVAVAPELTGLIPARTATPTIYWFQAAPGGEPAPGDRQVGKYLLDSHGAWKNVARSGEFSGYGKHVVNGPDGKPQLILEVSPL